MNLQFAGIKGCSAIGSLTHCMGFGILQKKQCYNNHSSPWYPQ